MISRGARRIGTTVAGAGGRVRLVPAVVLLALLAFARAADGLELEIVNRSGKPADQVYVTVAGGGSFDVPGMSNDQPVKLSTIPSGRLTVNELVSGRLYVSYAAGVRSSVPFDSPTRFHWAELTVTPSSSDVANLTAVDQFAIAMRLDTLSGSGRVLETLDSANAGQVFEALRSIPGSRQASVTDGSGRIVRILSPIHSDAYSTLRDYVRSLGGQSVHLRTAFFGSPFTVSSYSGRFEADGSIELMGTTDPPGQAPARISIDGERLIGDIYTGGNTPNNLQGAIYRDLLSGFSVGLWGGRYGNDALDFCSDPASSEQGSWCPSGFNRPAFGEARNGFSSYATCEQYAAVIDGLSDAYGNPYSDASKRVQIGLDQPQTGGRVAGLRLTILPDRGNSGPVEAGNPNCGASTLSGGGLRLRRQARVRRGGARVGKLVCPPACGAVRVKAAPRHGRRPLARGTQRLTTTGSARLAVRLTRSGKRRLERRRRLSVRYRVKLLSGGVKLGTRTGRAVLER